MVAVPFENQRLQPSGTWVPEETPTRPSSLPVEKFPLASYFGASSPATGIELHRECGIKSLYYVQIAAHPAGMVPRTK
jgi:hypothetical protein